MRRLLERRGNFAVKLVNLCVVVACIVGFSSWAAEVNAADAQVQARIDAAQRAAQRGPYANDGTYEGSAKGYGGTVIMSVTIKDGYIDSVDVVDVSHEDESWLKMCEGIPDAIVEAQTPDVDAVSGATFTSTGMVNAVKKALADEEAGGGE